MQYLNQPAVLVTADGQVFKGKSVGAESTSKPLFRTGEVVFNTAMTGYQEILTDPSYTEQMVCLTYPHIGNTGINLEDFESKSIHVKGLIMRDMAVYPSNWRKEQSLSFFLKAHNIVGIAEIDTRKLTHHIRNSGAQMGCIVVAPEITEALIQEAIVQAKEAPGLEGRGLTGAVSTQNAYAWVEKSWHQKNQVNTKSTHVKETELDIIVYDFGVKHAILRMLVDRGCKVTVVPATTPVESIIERRPDGVVLSNGPGDPKACTFAIENTKKLLTQKIPIFGICLGLQILGLSCGADTVKMKFGHHGANHPVQCLKTKKVFITSQNHGFAIDDKTLPNYLVPTHVSLFDGSLQGIRHKVLPALGFQGHPEASPGPQDIDVLFDEFVKMVTIYQENKFTQIL